MREAVFRSVRRDIRAWAPSVVRFNSLKGLADELERPLSVAVARTDNLGDWVMTIPLIQALRAAREVGRLELAAMGGVADLLARGPVDGVVPIDLELAGTGGRLTPRSVAKRLAAVSVLGQREALRRGRAHRGRWDLVVLPRYDLDVGWNARAWALGTGARLVGHDPAFRRGVMATEAREGAVLSLPVNDIRAVAHESQRGIALAEALGLVPVLSTTSAADFFGVTPQAGDVTLGVHTGATWGSRKWPIERWVEVIELAGELGFTDFLLIGGPEDADDHAAMMRQLPHARSMAGKFPLRDLPDVLAGLSALVGNDSGPAHLAAGLGLPTVAVFKDPVGVAELPIRMRPLGPRAEIIQPAHAADASCAVDPSGCMVGHPHCILAIHPGDVVRALAAAVS